MCDVKRIGVVEGTQVLPYIQPRVHFANSPLQLHSLFHADKSIPPVSIHICYLFLPCRRFVSRLLVSFSALRKCSTTINFHETMSSRRIKTQRKTDLRRKNLGLLDGSINVDGAEDGFGSSKPNKILFGDDFVASDYESEQDGSKEKEGTNSFHQESFSDDEVEQVSASTATKQAMELLAAERKTRREENALVSKRKRKAKESLTSDNKQEKGTGGDDDEEDDQILDDDFFALVDEERKTEAELKKLRRKKNSKKVGRHTTFVSDADHDDVEGSIVRPMDADHGIQVVVLPDSSAEDGLQDKVQKEKYLESLTASLGTEPSKTALLYCRGSQALQNSNLAEKGFEVKRSRKMKCSLARGRPSGIFKVASGK